MPTEREQSPIDASNVQTESTEGIHTCESSGLSEVLWRGSVCDGCAQVFDQRDDGMVILLDETPPPELHRAVREAAIVCPGAAIRLEERAG